MTKTEREKRVAEIQRIQAVSEAEAKMILAIELGELLSDTKSIKPKKSAK